MSQCAEASNQKITRCAKKQGNMIHKKENVTYKNQIHKW